MSDTVVVLSFIQRVRSHTLSIMSKILQVSCHSYSGCDVTRVVYVMSYTVGSVFRNIVDVMSLIQSFDVSKSGCDIT